MKLKTALENKILDEIQDINYRTTISGKTQTEVKSFFTLIKAYISEVNYKKPKQKIKKTMLTTLKKEPKLHYYVVKGIDNKGKEFKIITRDVCIKDKVL